MDRIRKALAEDDGGRGNDSRSQLLQMSLLRSHLLAFYMSLLTGGGNSTSPSYIIYLYSPSLPLRLIYFIFLTEKHLVKESQIHPLVAIRGLHWNRNRIVYDIMREFKTIFRLYISLLSGVKTSLWKTRQNPTLSAIHYWPNGNLPFLTKHSAISFEFINTSNMKL